MGTTRAAAWLQAALVGVVGLLIAVSLCVGVADASASTPAATAVSLSIDPSGPVRPDTPVTYRATVTPAVNGRVLFTFEQSGTAISYADCVAGVAEFQAKLHRLGTQLVIAQFIPADPNAYAGSTSATVPLVISLTPSVAVATSTGSLLPSGAQVAPAQQLQALIAGFVPGSIATVTFDGTVIVPSIVVGGNTRGQAPFIVPVGLSVGSHSLVARSGSLSASLQMLVSSSSSVVLVPVPVAVSTPTPTPSAYPSSTAGIPDTGTRSALAQTGGDPLDLGLGALLLMVVGLLLMQVRPGYAGAHARSSAAHTVQGRAGARHAQGGRHRVA